MPGCGMHSRPKLAEKARYNSLLKIKYKKQQKRHILTHLFILSSLALLHYAPLFPQLEHCWYAKNESQNFPTDLAMHMMEILTI